MNNSQQLMLGHDDLVWLGRLACNTETADTGIDLTKILGEQTKLLGGQKVVKIDKCMGVSKLLGGPGCPPKSTPMSAGLILRPGVVICVVGTFTISQHHQCSVLWSSPLRKERHPSNTVVLHYCTLSVGR